MLKKLKKLKTKKAGVKPAFYLSGSLKGSRTPHSAVKGRRLNRLTMRPHICDNVEYI